jgi:hypothetical protein
MFKRQRFQRHARKMTKMGKKIMSGGNIVASHMAKQHGFSKVFDQGTVHIPREIEWHKGC